MQITKIFKHTTLKYRIFPCSVLFIALGVSSLGWAQTMVNITNTNNSQPAQDTAPAMNLPSTGMTMQQVASSFGQPAEKQPSVGKPPITIWRYADFNVYFEYQRVLHSVRFVPYVRLIQIIIE